MYMKDSLKPVLSVSDLVKLRRGSFNDAKCQISKL